MVKKKRAQIWYFDLIMGLVVFSAFLIIFFKTDVNTSQEETRAMEDMITEAKIATSEILNSGVPKKWDITNVSKIGILDNNEINKTKLQYLSALNYNTTKSMMGLRSDYYFYFAKNGHKIKPLGFEGIGKPGINSTNIEQKEDPTRIIKLVRIVILNDNPAKMEFILWRQYD